MILRTLRFHQGGIETKGRRERVGDSTDNKERRTGTMRNQTQMRPSKYHRAKIRKSIAVLEDLAKTDPQQYCYALTQLANRNPYCATVVAARLKLDYEKQCSTVTGSLRTWT